MCRAQGLAQVRADGPGEREPQAFGDDRLHHTERPGVSPGELEAELGLEGRVGILGKGTLENRLRGGKACRKLLGALGVPTQGPAPDKVVPNI